MKNKQQRHLGYDPVTRQGMTTPQHSRPGNNRSPTSPRSYGQATTMFYNNFGTSQDQQMAMKGYFKDSTTGYFFRADRKRGNVKMFDGLLIFTIIFTILWVIGLIILTLLIMIFYSNSEILIILSLLNVIFLLLHLKFIIFVGFTKGLLMAFGVMISCYLDTFLMLIGVVFANVSYIFGEKY